MKNENLTSLDVIRFLLVGQGEIAASIQRGAEDYWDPAQQGTVFFAFVNELMTHKDVVNWSVLFTAIETVLSDPKYETHADTVMTHVLEDLSNAVANKALDTKCLTENAGPLARAHMKSWELAMDGKTIF
jgi:hypothetical protein